MINRRVVLRSHPAAHPAPDNFDVVETDVPEPGDGEVLVRNLYFSMEPAIRARLDGKETDGIREALVALHEWVRARASWWCWRT
jgi:NADPH-dependent curcumin reductase CurA